MTKHGLTGPQLQTLKQILSPFAASIERVGLFGSRATGHHRPNSDIDLVIYGALDEPTVDRISTLLNESSLPVKVDVVAYHLVTYPPFKEHIDGVMLPIFIHDDLLTNSKKDKPFNILDHFTQTFSLLEQYDKSMPLESQTQPGGELPSLDEARSALTELKNDLMLRGEATSMFGYERDNGLAAILGNLEQTVSGEAVYPSIESKAAHLLYFIVKNRPFTDGNKICASYLFIDFLNRNQRLKNKNGEFVINDNGLASLTLLIAESNPEQKDMIVRLVMSMLGGNHGKQ